MEQQDWCPQDFPYRLCAGTDEVGRGPLAGDVVAAAVLFEEGVVIPGLDDSKKLSERQRENLFGIIQQRALCFAIGRATVAEIDRLNILNASLLAMERAVASLSVQPEFVFVDGNRCPAWSYPSLAIVQGDSKVPSIAAASILAKVTRDREMAQLDQQFPGYGFARHKGYPTAMHMQALAKLGPCPLHRQSFAPVRELL